MSILPSGINVTGPHRRRSYPPADSGLPVGVNTIPDILNWIDEDLDNDAERAARAQIALDVENAKSHPRTTLVSRLEEVLSTTPEDGGLTPSSDGVPTPDPSDTTTTP